MKSFYSLSIIAAVSSANKTLEEVYGHVEPTTELRPWSERQDSRTFASVDPQYRALRTPDNCKFPLEIVILQDATASFQDDYAIMRDVQLNLMTTALKASHPESTFAVLSFRDKPVWSLGDATDYCQRFEAPLSADVGDLKAVYDRLVSTGGADPAENQFGAIIAAAQSQTPGWTSASSSMSTRLMVLSTDAYPHFADDGLNTYGMTTFSGVFDEADADAQCLKEYYPSPQQVKMALADRQAYLAQLIFDGDWNNGLVRRSWEWMNNYLEQTSAFLEPLANDASNFWTMLSSVIKAIEEAECVPVTTPAPATTTPAPETTTPAPTTTAPSTTVLETTTTMTTTSAPITLPPPVTATVTPEVPVTEVGTTEASTSDVMPTECSPCPTCPENAECSPCGCDEQVLIKLAYRPKSLNLIVNNEDII